MPRHFYNTIELEGRELVIAEMNNQTQEERVLLFLQRNYPDDFTAYEIADAVLPNAPKTSAGRALTNLEQWYRIRKTRKVQERYGMENYRYQSLGGL